MQPGLGDANNRANMEGSRRSQIQLSGRYGVPHQRSGTGRAARAHAVEGAQLKMSVSSVAMTAGKSLASLLQLKGQII